MSGRPISDLRAVVVGVGFVGHTHIESLRRLGVAIAGVVGSSPERTAAKAAALGIPTVYPDLDAALCEDSVDVVHVASPNHLHCRQATSVLSAGKHLVVEKPLGRDAAETARLVDQAADSSLVNAVCFNLRYYPLNQQMAAMVRDGAIGATRLVSGAYLQDWLLHATDWNWRLDSDEGGRLRAIADIGSHWLDLAQFVTGQRIVEVCADLHTFLPVRRRPPGPRETFTTDDPDGPDGELMDVVITSDDAAGVLLRFESGARGVVTISQASAGRKNSMSIEVDGATAAMSWSSERAEELWIGHRDVPNELLLRDPGLLADGVRRHVGYPGGHPEGYADSFRAFFREVYTDIAAGKPSAEPTYATIADGHASMVLIEAIARSAEERRWVAVADLQPAATNDQADRHAGGHTP
ncbi:MAG: Gfo/Idh/MocA family protein [Ilumatobacteraceae bacterium]